MAWKRMGFKVWFKGNRTLRSILRNDKEKMPLDQCPGVVYEIKCECSASYIGETGNALAHRYQEHVKSLTRYRNALNRLNGGPPNTSRGRSPTLDPRDSMEQAAQTSAVAQHAAECTGQLQAKVLCRERQFMTRKIKEALYIKYNSNINRDNGTAGRFSVNLRGTGFRVSHLTKWIENGHLAYAEVRRNVNSEVVVGVCGGFCGNCFPDKSVGLLLEVVEPHSRPHTYGSSTAPWWNLLKGGLENVGRTTVKCKPTEYFCSTKKTIYQLNHMGIKGSARVFVRSRRRSISSSISPIIAL
ncbi:hypothetical protein M514_23352 [Trichuris suis]|uniref:GON domain-containing protein n=1 Tax=Trichuris suis TaxID=68888 RepID=A0A085N4V9_9BILA|nr:hypothetical protein M514_23352 [Trichuris suis]